MRQGAQSRAWHWAMLALALVLAWQALTVYANYGGQWSVLFRTGQKPRLPAALEAHTARDASEGGYDGQFYHMLAHDPLAGAETVKCLDGPIWRARRILVPGMAWLLAAGQPVLIDPVYILLLAAFTATGVYWLSRLLAQQGFHEAWGLSFLAIPSVICSIDRLTVDNVLTALTAGFAWYWLGRRRAAVWLVLAAAVLVRETGLILIVAAVGASLWERRWKEALVWVSACAPTAAWYGFLERTMPAVAVADPNARVPHWAVPRFEIGILASALNPPHYDLPPMMEAIARGLDSTAMLAMLAAALVALWWSRTWKPDALRLASAGHAALVFAMTRRYFWITPFGYARPYGPMHLLLLVACGATLTRRRLLTALGLSLLVDLRLMSEIYRQALGILRWLF